MVKSVYLEILYIHIKLCGLIKIPQCITHTDIKIVKMMLSSKKEHNNLVALIKVLVTIIHLQVLSPIKIGYLLLTNCHLMLSGDSASQTVHYIISFLFSQNS